MPFTKFYFWTANFRKSLSNGVNNKSWDDNYLKPPTPFVLNMCVEILPDITSVIKAADFIMTFTLLELNRVASLFITIT
jgi:hypothetical protein